MRRSHPPEFRRRVLDLVESGRKVAEVAKLLGISDADHLWLAPPIARPTAKTRSVAY
ncbi:transposase [Streptomyces sp. NPDC001401]|uniref:transposase n=1 Tax=Streptomyces sp. NPDC001401 TaxID=3364570 RepID=UPI0036AFA7DC